MTFREGFSPTPEELGLKETVPGNTEKTAEEEADRALAKLLKRLIRGGIAANLALISAIYVNEKIGLQKYQEEHGEKIQAVEQLKSKEGRLQELFGEEYIARTEYYHRNLQNQKDKYKGRGIFAEDMAEEMNDYLINPDFRWDGERDSETLSEVTDLRGVDGTFSKKELTKVLQETYPKGWVKGEVSKVVQGAADRGPGEAYGLSKDKYPSTLAFCKTNRQDDISEIHYTQAAERCSMHEIVEDTLGHELAHANDWERDNEMSINERADLLLSVADRLDDDDRYISDYVESISNQDAKKQRYLKAVEYWAEISAAYFQDPDSLNVKDWYLVDSHIKKTDPGFDAHDQAAKRSDMVEKGTH